jgi:cytochrome b561
MSRTSAMFSHWLLYLIMIGMPLSGYLLSAWGGHAVTYFGLFTVPGLGKNDTLQARRILGARRHRSMADLCCHSPPYWGDRLAVRRDGVLFRMLPEQTAATDIAARVHNTH